MARYARDTNARTLPEVLPGANIFLGLSAPGVLKPEWLPLLADNPLIFALANPEPEIRPEVAREARPGAIVATGRSDYPNQVNNVHRAVAARKGVPSAEIIRHVRRRPTVTAAMLLRTGHVDAALVGGNSEYWGRSNMCCAPSIVRRTPSASTRCQA